MSNCINIFLKLCSFVLSEELAKTLGRRSAPTRQVGLVCPLSKKCELILTQIFDALRSNKGGVKGEGIVAERRVPAQLRFAEPREHCMVGLLAHPTAVGFANPIVFCSNVLKHQ